VGERASTVPCSCLCRDACNTSGRKDIFLHASELCKGSSAPLAAVVVCCWDKSGAQGTSCAERCFVDRCCGVDGDSVFAVVSSCHCCRQFLFAPGSGPKASCVLLTCAEASLRSFFQ
jgi:hypothetical protein